LDKQKRKLVLRVLNDKDQICEDVPGQLHLRVSVGVNAGKLNRNPFFRKQEEILWGITKYNYSRISASVPLGTRKNRNGTFAK